MGTDKYMIGNTIRGEEKYIQNINGHIWGEILENIWLK